MQDCFEDHGGTDTQSLGEEIANGISHGVGLVAALVASPFLILVAARKDQPLSVVAVCIFATSMVLLYLSSMMYHCLPRRPAKRLFAIFDHIAIFLLIAGNLYALCLGGAARHLGVDAFRSDLGRRFVWNHHQSGAEASASKTFPGPLPGDGVDDRAGSSPPLPALAIKRHALAGRRRPGLYRRGDFLCGQGKVLPFRLASFLPSPVRPAIFSRSSGTRFRATARIVRGLPTWPGNDRRACVVRPKLIQVLSRRKPA